MLGPPGYSSRSQLSQLGLRPHLLHNSTKETTMTTKPNNTKCTYCDDKYQCPDCRMDEAEKKLGKPLTAETIPGSTPIFFL
jgi:hypothetical protein